LIKDVYILRTLNFLKVANLKNAPGIHFRLLNKSDSFPCTPGALVTDDNLVYKIFHC